MDEHRPFTARPRTDTYGEPFNKTGVLLDPIPVRLLQGVPFFPQPTRGKSNATPLQHATTLAHLEPPVQQKPVNFIGSDASPDAIGGLQQPNRKSPAREDASADQSRHSRADNRNLRRKSQTSAQQCCGIEAAKNRQADTADPAAAIAAAAAATEQRELGRDATRMQSVTRCLPPPPCPGALLLVEESCVVADTTKPGLLTALQPLLCLGGLGYDTRHCLDEHQVSILLYCPLCPTSETRSLAISTPRPTLPSSLRGTVSIRLGLTSNGQDPTVVKHVRDSKPLLMPMAFFLTSTSGGFFFFTPRVSTDLIKSHGLRRGEHDERHTTTGAGQCLSPFVRRERKAGGLHV